MDRTEYRKRWEQMMAEYNRWGSRIAVAGLIGGGIRDIPPDIDKLEQKFEYLIYRVPIMDGDLEENLAELTEIIAELKEKINQLETKNRKGR